MTYHATQHLDIPMLTMRCGERLLASSRPAVMGIINVNDDSFYSGSRVATVSDAVMRAGEHLNEGAQILDIGVMSSRPGAVELDEQKEAELLSETIQAIHQAYPSAFISADCYRATVAQAALNAGASIINDIGGGRWDRKMYDVVADYNAGYILMHSRSKPMNMVMDPALENPMVEMLDYFDEHLSTARRAGVNDIWIDPGLGFSKSSADNFALLRSLHILQQLRVPILVGLSRKSFIYKTLGITPEESLQGTTAMHVVALMRGASVLRVHDVEAAVQTINLLSYV